MVYRVFTSLLVLVIAGLSLFRKLNISRIRWNDNALTFLKNYGVILHIFMGKLDTWDKDKIISFRQRIRYK